MPSIRLERSAATPARASSNSIARNRVRDHLDRCRHRPAEGVLLPRSLRRSILAAHTGLRLGDLLRLSWSHIGDDAISSGRARAITDARRSYRCTTPCDRCWPVSRSARQPSSRKAAVDRGRGTASDRHSTRRRSPPAWLIATFTSTICEARRRRGSIIAGLSERVIAEIMGWEEEHVARIIRRYVDRTAATQAVIAQLNKKEEHNLQNRLQNRGCNIALSIGAGDENRTHDIQLGKLSFYH